jgi:glucose-1-phosphate thymidylyltransferase
VKGIVLAGGTGSRLWPITKGLSKHLLPIYDKPLIYYPISTLMLAGMQEICVVTTPKDLSNYQDLLGDGSRFGINLSYKVQAHPEGIPQVFSLVHQFIGDSPVSLILGDNLFHGMGLGGKLRELTNVSGAHIFGYKVQNPEAYGVLELNSSKEIVRILEKPNKPPSRLAVPGMYFFDNSVVERSRNLKKSARGEFEITDLITEYLESGELKYSILERGTMWLDCGTPSSILAASNYVQAIEERQGLKMAALEEIAWRNGWISSQTLIEAANHFPNEYGNYLLSLIDD